MARIESDREDLMREATAYGRRAECRLPGDDEVVFAGLRATGACSVYFGADPVYHLDDESRLRRAFVDGDLYRTQGTTLARLRRHRTESATELRRVDLDEDSLTTFLAKMHERLGMLATAIETEAVDRLAAIPADDDPWPDVAAAIRRLLQLERPLAPLIAGRR